jgi:hypothetical protein
VVSLVLLLAVLVSQYFPRPFFAHVTSLLLLIQTVESPAQKWPNVFGEIPLFVTYPYLLPTSIAASVTLGGVLLFCL